MNPVMPDDPPPPPEEPSATDEAAGRQRLEEYRTLQLQAQKYLDQRQPILGLTVTGIGGLMAFGVHHSSIAIEIPLLLFTLVGSVLTRQCNFQAMKMLSYIRVFIEPETKGLRWCHRLELATNAAERATSWRRLVKRFIPQEYTAVYLILGCVVTLYSLVLLPNPTKLMYTVAAVGFGVLLLVCVDMQRTNSTSRFRKFVSMWEAVRASEEE